MRNAFVRRVIRQLQEEGSLSMQSSVLAVCAGDSERDLFVESKFTRVVLTSLDPVVTSGAMNPFEGRIADVRVLPFPDRAFDFVFVSDGLHHCDSPHHALCEMYRVARQGVLVFESRDSLIMRLSVALGMTEEYEISAVKAGSGLVGGVNYSAIPNFVYRWTEREFEKTIACADPTGRPSFRYFYGFNPPAREYSGMRGLAYKAGLAAMGILSRVLPRQANSFCMTARRPDALFPWLSRKDGTTRFNRYWA